MRSLRSPDAVVRVVDSIIGDIHRQTAAGREYQGIGLPHFSRSKPDHCVRRGARTCLEFLDADCRGFDINAIRSSRVYLYRFGQLLPFCYVTVKASIYRKLDC